MVIMDAQPGAVLRLGYSGEGNSRVIRFSLKDWSRVYGPGIASLVASRYGDEESYPAPLIQEGDVALWRVRRVDAAMAGAGWCELQYRVNDTVVKQERWVTEVEVSPTDAFSDPEDPDLGYLEQILDAGTLALHAQAESQRLAQEMEAESQRLTLEMEAAKAAAASAEATAQAAAKAAAASEKNARTYATDSAANGMKRSVYDTRNKQQDVYNYCDKAIEEALVMTLKNYMGIDLLVEDRLITRELTTYENGRVQSVGPFALYRAPVTAVNFPKVLTVGESAFAACAALTDVALPEAESIGKAAFSSCASLAAITLPAAVTLEATALAGCGALTAVSLPVAETVGAGVFAACNRLANVDAPMLKILGASAFDGCTALTMLTLPAVESVGDKAFRNCTALERVVGPCLSLGFGAFESCGTLTEVVTQAKTVGESAFEGCDNLRFVQLGKAYIGDRAFADCEQLTQVQSSAEYIGHSAFENCRSLTAMATAAETIEAEAFSGSGLRELTLTGSNPCQLGATSAFLGISSLTLRVQPDLVEYYQTNTMWSRAVPNLTVRSL